MKSIQLNDVRVLVADDSADTQYLFRRILVKAGAQVEVASNGREAVEKALAGDFDIIVMDFEMPEMDGAAATEALRSQDFSKPILIVSAHPAGDIRQRCLNSGAQNFLSKPVDRQKLVAMVESLMDARLVE